MFGDIKMFYTTEQISEHISKTPEGFLLCSSVPIARIGDYEYSKDEVPIESNGKMVIIHRDEDEVFSPNAIMSFNGKPITINHPSDFVTPENWNEYAHGTVQNVRRGEGEQEDLLLADLIINTEKAINLVENGLREISCGYDATYEDEGNGEGRQRNIIGNHVALVLQGRAGNRCSIQDGCSCNGCGKCKNKTEVKIGMKAKDLFKRLFPKSRFADALSEEDLGEVNEGAVGGAEEAIQAASEAKEAAAEAVEAAKKADEIAKSIESVAPAPTEGGNEEATPDLNAVVEKLNKLEELIMQLIGGETEPTDEGETEEEKQKRLEEEQAIKDAEEEAEKEDEELKGEFQDVAATATLIDPSIVINQPNKGYKKFYTQLKKTTLKRGMTGDHAKTVKSLLRGKTVDSLNDGELDTAFVSAAHIISMTRDASIKINTDFNKKGNTVTVSDINKKNKEFWKR